MTGAARPLAAFSVFAQLPQAELELISSTARTVRFAARQRLFSEGHPAQGCWLIEDGRVALDMTVPGRGQVVLQTLGPGDVLGWSWLVPPYRWHYGATSVLPTTATELDTVWWRSRRAGSPVWLHAGADLVRRGPAAPASHPGPAPRPLREPG